MKKLTYTLVLALVSSMAIAQSCSNLFFSEYVEGTSNNKAIEVFNASSSSLDLSNYIFYRYTNGSATPTDTLLPSGMLAAGDVYIIGNPSADTAITNKADTLHSLTYFNGDDALSIYDISLGQLIDVIGEIGNDPGTNWTVGAGATSEFTLVRKVTVQEGTTNWTTGATQWDVFPQNTFTYLGAHSMNPCGPITDTTVVFSSTSVHVNEGIGTTDLNLNLNISGNTNTYTVDVMLLSGDSTQIGNFATQTVTFNSTISESLTVTITDDTIQEGPDTLVFKLTNPGGNLLVGADSLFTLIIDANDVPAPLYTIATVRGTNTDGQPDSLGVRCQLKGVVYGINFSPTGLSFVLNDGTAGIWVYAPGSVGNLGYTVTEGDSIAIIGEIDVNRGGSEIAFLESISVLASGVSLPTPAIVTTLDETTEGELIEIEGVHITDTISSTASGQTLEVTDDQSRVFVVRIDADANIGTLPARFSVIGLGNQFASSSSSPFADGYQIQPRKTADIIDLTGINTVELVEVSVYPNPVSGTLNLAGLNGKQLSRVSISDLSGREVKVWNASELTGKQTFDVTGLDNGMYIIYGQTADNKMLVSKFIKE